MLLAIVSRPLWRITVNELLFSPRELSWREQFNNYLKATISTILSALMWTTNLAERNHFMVGSTLDIL